MRSMFAQSRSSRVYAVDAGRQAIGSSQLDAVTLDVLDAEGSDLARRWSRHQDFWDHRLAVGLDSSARVLLNQPGAEAEALTRGQKHVRGINFASYDYLSLA